MPKLTITLPKSGKILVKSGEKVDKDDPLVEFEDSELLSVNLAKILHIPASKVINHLCKKIDDQVESGEILASNKSLFAKRAFKSPVSGTVYSFGGNTGVMEIKTKGNVHKLTSPLQGVIEEINGNKSLTIEFDGELVLAKEALGNKYGTLCVLTEPNQVVDIFSINSGMSQKILLGYQWSLECLKKAWALDCGIIGVSMHIDKKQNWQYDLPVFMVVGRDAFDTISKYNGKSAVILEKERKLYIQL